MTKIIIDNIHNETNFKSGWMSIESEMQTALQAEIIGTTYGQSPSYSSYIQMEKISQGNLIQFKEIHFFISLIGPFYTIIGQDRNEIRFDKKKFRNTNFLTVSPEIEYEALFKKISEQIESKFAGFKFVPYFIYSQVIDGLHTRFFRTDKKYKVFDQFLTPRLIWMRPF